VTYVILLGKPCAVSNTNLYWGFLMYTSYFILFARFFYFAYFTPKVRPVSKKID